MKPIHLSALLMLINTSFAQVKLAKLTAATIPKNMAYVGQLKNAVQWTDSLRKNIVITTETGITPSRNVPDSRDAALYAWHYVTQGDSMKLIWKFQDYVRECPVDVEANFVSNTFAVTDVNNNGKAEIWLLYKINCQGDVGPGDMKLMMKERKNTLYAAELN